jgi:RsmE family RNA methyltransferase
MNIILLKKEEIIDNLEIDLSLNDRRSEHITKVLRSRPGDSIKIGIINGNRGTGILKELENSLKIEVQNLNTPPPPPIKATLIIAMQRPKTMKKILQSATAMGVKKIYIIETWKVEKSYWTSPLLNQKNLLEQLLLGLEQAGDTVIPEIIIKKQFKPFVEDELPAIIANTTPIIAHPYSEILCPHAIRQEAAIAIGPEGGFTEYEIVKMEDIGMKSVNIGERTLRSEFAVTAILAKLF